MMPIYRRRSLSKRTRSRSTRVPFDPRVLQFRPSSSNHSHIFRPLLQLVQRQHTARIRQARSDMEKKLEEVNKRLEIFSELNDAYQALIDNLKGVQHDQTQRIEHLESALERMRQSQAPASSSNSTPSSSASSSSPPSIKRVISATVDQQEEEEDDDDDEEEMEEDGNSNLPVIVASDGSLSYATNGGGGNHRRNHLRHSLAPMVVEQGQQTDEDDGSSGTQESLETEIIYDFV